LEDASPAAVSFGELPAASCAGLAEGLREALERTAEEVEEAAREAEGSPSVEAPGITEALDRLLEKYAAEEANIADRADVKIVNNAPSTEAGTSVKELQARTAHLRAVGGRLTALLPCLAEDLATTRLVSSLTALDIGSAGVPYSDAECCAADFRAPLRVLSTADVCWALCSEKRRLVADSLLPGVLSQGRWSWPEIRRTGVGWWLCGAGTEVLDALVTKLAQSAVAQLRQKATSAQPALFRTDSAVVSAKFMADEALFWYVLLGTKLARLRALLKTGILSGEPALTKLLEHPRSGEAQFIRKNAFRLLQLHRFHLAAALFVLSDSHDEAARVVAGHLCDLQLVLVLTRHRPAVAKQLLLDHMDSPLAQRDPWLRMLLAWHAGDRDAVLRCTQPAEPACIMEPVPDGMAPVPLFDGALRLSSSDEGLQEVGQHLSGAGG